MPWSPSSTHLVLFLPVCIITVDVIRRLVRSRRERDGSSLPPGPTSVPFLGNVLSVSAEWQAEYDQEVVVLNSQSVAMELLEKRSRIYLRSAFHCHSGTIWNGCNFAFARHGDHWRLCRRIFHQTFRADAALTFRPMQLRRACQLIVNMIDDPDEYAFHFSTFSAAVAMSAVYDYEPSPRNDPMIHIVDRFLQASIPAIAPEKAILLKIFPFHWLPGSSLKLEARTGYEWGIKMVETPYQYVQKRMEAATERPIVSMVSDHITRMQECDNTTRSEYESALKHASATAFLGSAETVWKRAQAEIDTVVGMGKLPNFDDRPLLPYIDAVLRERSRTTTFKVSSPESPQGVPHAASSSDIYKGFYIPSGAIVYANIWAMSRDEARYPTAEQFIPERFLTTGRHAAQASLWSAIATMLATLDFGPSKDAEGKDIAFEPKYTNGATRHPEDFPCCISPRSHITKGSLERALAD
ncbi:cytochrome P450 [Melanogaster broomeanus]|nr:cytochrome P450 [Melanogaster broomeanus]